MYNVDSAMYTFIVWFPTSCLPLHTVSKKISFDIKAVKTKYFENDYFFKDEVMYTEKKFTLKIFWVKTVFF